MPVSFRGRDWPSSEGPPLLPNRYYIPLLSDHVHPHRQNLKNTNLIEGVVASASCRCIPLTRHGQDAHATICLHPCGLPPAILLPSILTAFPITPLPHR